MDSRDQPPSAISTVGFIQSLPQCGSKILKWQAYPRTLILNHQKHAKCSFGKSCCVAKTLPNIIW